jgi:hypothetical protein
MLLRFLIASSVEMALCMKPLVRWAKVKKSLFMAKLPGYIQVGIDDLIEKYLFLTTSHDGKGSITAAFTPVRIVCTNTLNAALKNMTNVVKIRHTSNAAERLRTAQKVMGIASRFSKEIGATFNEWARTPITDPQMKKLIEIAMAPNKEVLGNLKDGKVNALSTQFVNIVEDVYEYALQIQHSSYLQQWELYLVHTML